MHHQDATTVVARPLEEVERRLADVTTWPRFLHGVAQVERLGHERFRFRIEDGGERREVLVCVHHDLAAHSFGWKALEGPAYRGHVRLAAVDARHTAVRLDLEAHPTGLASGLAEMLAPRRSRAELDVRLLAESLSS